MTPMTVSTLSQGGKAKVVGFREIESSHKQRLLAMGLTPGTIFTLLRCAPLGDPVILCVRDSHLVLRKQEANCLEIEVLV